MHQSLRELTKVAEAGLLERDRRGTQQVRAKEFAAKAKKEPFLVDVLASRPTLQRRTGALIQFQ